MESGEVGVEVVLELRNLDEKMLTEAFQLSLFFQSTRSLLSSLQWLWLCSSRLWQRLLKAMHYSNSISLHHGEGAVFNIAELQMVEQRVRVALMLRFGINRTIITILQPRALHQIFGSNFKHDAAFEALHTGLLNDCILYHQTSDTSLRHLQLNDTVVHPNKHPAIEMIKSKAARIIAEELDMNVEEILTRSEDSSKDLSSTLDELGLDSLKAMSITSRFQREFELTKRVSPFAFFNDPTLDGITHQLVGMTNAERENAPSANPTNFSSGELGFIFSAPPPLTKGKGLSYILALGCAVPSSCFSQSDIVAHLADSMKLSEERRETFDKIMRACQVDQRHSVLSSVQELTFDHVYSNDEATIEKRNKVFRDKAPELALKAASRALKEWGGSSSSITHIISVTSTGLMMPGLDFFLQIELGLSVHCQRTTVHSMGCIGAMVALRNANSIVAEKANSRVLVVCCELCSLHAQLDHRVDNLLASCLFGDGAAALVIGGDLHADEKPLYEVHGSQSALLPDSVDFLTWSLSNHGMVLGLSRKIPATIYNHLPDFVARLLANTGVVAKTQSQEMKWVFHPGGPMIISAVRDSLGLEELQMQPMREVLRKYGNMSSCTILFVLEQFREIRDTHWIPCIAFGPGLSVDGVMLKGCL